MITMTYLVTISPHTKLLHYWHIPYSVYYMPMTYYITGGLYLLIPSAYLVPQKRKYLVSFIFFFRAAPVAYGSSQTRGWNGATAASLCHSHSNTRSKPHLWPTPQLWQQWILNPLSEARDWTCILLDTSWVCNPLSHK